jgi:hypothetical protein
MVGMPAFEAVTRPVLIPTEASDGLLLVHDPLVGEDASVLVPPMQSTRVPVGTVGVWLTVSVRVTKQPVGSE